MTTEFENTRRLKLFVQRGLLGHVTRNLAAVFAHFEGTRIIVATYFFDEASEKDREYIEIAATEVIADFPSGYTIETCYGVLMDMELNSMLTCVFLRAEAAEYVNDKNTQRR